MNDDGGRLRPANQDDAQQVAPAGPTTPMGAWPTVRPPTARWRRWALRPAIGGLVAVAVFAVAATLVTRSTPRATMDTTVSTVESETGGNVDTASPQPVVAPRPVGDVELANLPEATTFGTVPTAPTDPAPAAAPRGRVVHPMSTVAVFAAPGGEPIAALPPQQLSSDTWLPVLAEQPGWALVALPVRPNGSTGWLYLHSPAITTARSPYRIDVDRTAFTLTLFKNNVQIGQWTAGIGKPHSPTPAGRTFLMASIKDTDPSFSPIVLPLGAHSDTYTSYGGGPGTVGIHTWPTRDVYGRPSSDGCIRIPPEALQLLSTEVPLGTVVLIK